MVEPHEFCASARIAGRRSRGTARASLPSLWLPCLARHSSSACSCGWRSGGDGCFSEVFRNEADERSFQRRLVENPGAPGRRRRAASSGPAFAVAAPAVHQGRRGRSRGAAGPDRGLCLSHDRAARRAAARRLGHDPGGARLHAAGLRVPRPLCRAQGTVHRSPVRALHPGAGGAVGGSGAAAPAVRALVGRRAPISPTRSRCRASRRRAGFS